MENNHGKIHFAWWKKNWDQQVWIVVSILLALLIASWGYWASSFGETKGGGRFAEIKRLIDSTHAWEAANQNLARFREVIIANPASVSDPVHALEDLENDVKTATENFDTAGFTALNGEMIIILGAMLQIIVTLVLVKEIEIFFTKRRRLSKNRLEVERERASWNEKIRAGQTLKDEDDILRLIDDERDILKLLKTEIKSGQQVSKAYRLLMTKCRKTSAAEIPWHQISSLFYKLMLICKEQKEKNDQNSISQEQWRNWESELMVQYNNLNRIIWQDTRDASYSSIVIPFLFVAVFTVLSVAWNSFCGTLLREQLTIWRNPVLLVGAAFAANGIVHVWVDWLARWVAEKTWTDFDDVIIGAIIGPLSALTNAILLLWALDVLTGPNNPPVEFGPFLVWVGYEAVANMQRTLLVIFIGTWFSVFLLNRVFVWAMEQWAKQTTQIYDDMFVKMIQVFGTFLLLAIGMGATLAVFNGPLSQATGVDNIILPYTIIVSVFTAIVGYAASAGFENFFGGLLLQIEKPFDRGERIILADGQVCDVRDVGMRSTVLYNVTEHSEVSVPNSEMAKMTIKNSSRPDLELRIAVPAKIYIGTHNLKIAGAILLDIAYLEKEIDQMRVLDEDLPNEERNKMMKTLILKGNRNTIKEEMERLSKRHAQIQKTIVSQMTGGKSEPVYAFDISDDTQKDPWRKVLTSIGKSRKKYQDILAEENRWLLKSIERNEGANADEIIRNYRRAINEVVHSEYAFTGKSDNDKLNDLIHQVALRECIIEDKLSNSLCYLSGSDGRINQNALLFIRKKLVEFEWARLGIVLDISDEVANMQNYIYAIGEQYPDVRPELDGIIGEMAKEPSVSSEYTDDGYAQITLNCYAIYMERKFEIQHKINRDIEWRFNNADIKFERSL